MEYKSKIMKIETMEEYENLVQIKIPDLRGTPVTKVDVLILPLLEEMYAKYKLIFITVLPYSCSLLFRKENK